MSEGAHTHLRGSDGDIVVHGPINPGSEVVIFFSCSIQLNMEFSLLINMKMPTTVGIFIFISRENFMLLNYV